MCAFCNVATIILEPDKRLCLNEHLTQFMSLNIGFTLACNVRLTSGEEDDGPHEIRRGDVEWGSELPLVDFILDVVLNAKTINFR